MPDVSSFPDLLKDIAGLGTGLAAVAGAVITILQYFRLTTYRDKVAATRKAFEGVVSSLASDKEVERLAGAILLRRFFDPTTEVTTKGTPYAAESIGVIAAILRSQPTGNFQKLLADGLAFAPSLQRADLQRTNLQNAYLGARREQQIDLSYADFYRADLSGTSLKGAKAPGAVFYQARMADAVLRNADLRGANFFEADLSGVHFDGAKLAGANFERAKNIPSELKPYLEGNLWNGPEVFKSSRQLAEADTAEVYVSRPGCLDAAQENIVDLVCGWLASNGLKGAGPTHVRVNSIDGWYYTTRPMR